MTTYDDDMPIYISIYDKPKRGKGRPFSCTLTDEEKKERTRNYEIFQRIKVI